jgi:NTP pyrophosphatase (non-canonical NTP hydrolase)
MCGEAGEAANVVKKIRRHETGMPDRIPLPQLLPMLADELGDVVAYADLTARYYGIDLGNAVARKFNKISEREGFPERLPTAKVCDGDECPADCVPCTSHDVSLWCDDCRFYGAQDAEPLR